MTLDQSGPWSDCNTPAAYQDNIFAFLYISYSLLGFFFLEGGYLLNFEILEHI